MFYEAKAGGGGFLTHEGGNLKNVDQGYRFSSTLKF